MTNSSYMKHIPEAYKLFFGSLGNPNRLAILSALRKKELNVTEICEVTGFEQTMVSHNMKRLETCGMVFLRKMGKHRYYSLNQESIKPLMSIIDGHISEYCAKVVGGCHK